MSNRHSINVPRVVALVACTGLVIASAGFGAVFGYHVGIQHGNLLAGLTVCFAVALELAKPLAIHACLQSLGSWRTWLRALALGILGVVAVAYSLTAELSLMAGSRGDLTAKREQAQDSSQAARERHQRAKSELATIKTSRPNLELEALIEQLENRGRDTTALAAELGRSKRRAELETILSKAETTLSSVPVVKAADPGSIALVTYLAAVGVLATVDSVSQWMTLVPVLALELASALAMVLVAAVTPKVKEPSKQLTVVPAEAELVPTEPQEIRPYRLLPDHSIHKEMVARLLIQHLENRNGTISGSERAIAKQVGTTKPTLRRTIQSLADAGLVEVDSAKRGTVLKLLT